MTYFCPVWFERSQSDEPWFMTFNQDTYCHDLLAILGERTFSPDVNSFTRWRLIWVRWKAMERAGGTPDTQE